MDVRDAVEADADRLAELTDTPRDVMRNLVHDRTVRVAVEDREGDGDGAGGTGEESGDGEPRVLGFVSFDARRETVHITQLEGDEEVTVRLLEEPRRFAATEGMALEWLVAATDEQRRTVAERVGFEEDGAGPRFDGTRTVRYRLDPA